MGALRSGEGCRVRAPQDTIIMITKFRRQGEFWGAVVAETIPTISSPTVGTRSHSSITKASFSPWSNHERLAGVTQLKLSQCWGKGTPKDTSTGTSEGRLSSLPSQASKAQALEPGLLYGMSLRPLTVHTWIPRIRFYLQGTKWQKEGKWLQPMKEFPQLCKMGGLFTGRAPDQKVPVNTTWSGGHSAHSSPGEARLRAPFNAFLTQRSQDTGHSRKTLRKNTKTWKWNSLNSQLRMLGGKNQNTPTENRWLSRKS